MSRVEIKQSNYKQYFTSNGNRTTDAVQNAPNNIYVLTENITFDSVLSMKLTDDETFDGQGHTINMNTLTYAGLFRPDSTSFETASVIKNLGVLGGNISDKGGGIILSAITYFIVENCYSTGTIGAECGGISGYASGGVKQCTISNCYSSGNISGDSAGGIVGSHAGYAGNCVITNCYSTGAISGNSAGGIAGLRAGIFGLCTITNCYSTRDMGQNAGGIAGAGAGYTGNCVITNCYSVGNIGLNGGGILGSGPGSEGGSYTIENCYSKLVSNGQGADGNFNISLLEGGNLDAGLNTSVTIGGITSEANQWIADTFEPNEYPLLASFRENLWDSSNYVNYNSEPSFIVPVLGCTDPTYQEYNSEATVNDETLCVTKIGCTDPTAFNYNENATINDGSCIAKVEGCTDPTAFNYNENANTDVGSCIPVVNGCTDPKMANYVSAANTDDGSCVYVNENGEAPNFAGYNSESGKLSLVNLRG